MDWFMSNKDKNDQQPILHNNIVVYISSAEMFFVSDN